MKRALGALTIYIIIGLILFNTIRQQVTLENVNMVAVNEILKEVEGCGGQWSKLDSLSFLYDFVVIDEKEKMLYQSGIYQETSSQRSKAEHNLCEKVGEVKVLIHTNNEQDFLNKVKKLSQYVLGIYIFIGIILISYLCFIWQYYFKPFRELEAFAHQIANGNLDIPLKRDKENLFGAFTASFDIMREELKEAKEKEYAANRSKQEIIASLSHDIKTPLTSIKLISEVLLIKRAKDEMLSKKIKAIYSHCEKIDTLISNLFQSTLEELGQLSVVIKEAYASCLVEMIHLADYKERVTIEGKAGGLILIDPIPMERVITNIIANSYKYAGTDIKVKFELNEQYLVLTFKDFGKGIPEEEIPLVFQKFYRGKDKAVQEKSGAGLGLYLCQHYMEEMGGNISIYNEADGFVVMLSVKLS